MTYEEAIEVINSDLVNYGEMVEVRAIVTKAVEKQIPREPELLYDGYADGRPVIDDWECGYCGVMFDYESTNRYKYCPMCGQAIDWSE